MNRIRSLIWIVTSSLTLLFSKSLDAQGNSHQNRVLILNKEVSEAGVQEADNEVLSKYRTGILVKQNLDGIIYKSHLRDYREINVALTSRNGELLYEYSDEVLKNVDYNISMTNLPVGEYVLKFEFNNRLVICNVQVEG